MIKSWPWLSEYLSRDPPLKDLLGSLFALWAQHITQSVHPAPRTVVVEGAGDAFRSRYLPTLSHYIRSGIVGLTVVDRGRKPTWLDAELDKFGVKGRVKYVAKFRPKRPENDENWTPQYKSLLGFHGPHIVLILVPDLAHTATARHWLDRANVILIEKPYDRLPAQAEQLHYALERHRATLVLPIDHYVAKLASFLLEPFRGGQSVIHDLVSRISPLQTIKFDLLEPHPIEGGREETLSQGLIYDFFSHVLATTLWIARPPTDEQCDPPDVRVIVEAVCRATYLIDGRPPPIGGNETFGHVRMTFYPDPLPPVVLTSAVGKGVSAEYARSDGEDTKFLRVEGRCGVFELDFTGNVHDRPGLRSRVFTAGPNLPDMETVKLTTADTYNWGKTVALGHPEILWSLLDGNYLSQPVGALSRNQALWILKQLYIIINQHRASNARVVEYAMSQDDKGNYVPITKEDLLDRCRTENGCA